jgi:hypothetical protein
MALMMCVMLNGTHHECDDCKDNDDECDDYDGNHDDECDDYDGNHDDECDDYDDNHDESDGNHDECDDYDGNHDAECDDHDGNLDDECDDHDGDDDDNHDDENVMEMNELMEMIMMGRSSSLDEECELRRSLLLSRECANRLLLTD